jgi:two-component system, OmpR family, alkaline phosphatase synthesis response regulator PhoP
VTPGTGGTGRLAPRLLLVEDEPTLVRALSDRLRAEGYEVHHAGDGEAALELVTSQPFDVMVLDLMLPRMDGLTVCRELRGRGLTLPVLMLTARSETVDKVVGLKLGADDYLTKPFETAELLARLEALLRRSAGAAAPGIYRFGSLQVDFRRAEVRRHGEPVALSAMELKLLRCFIEHRGEVLSRDRLLDEVWGHDAEPFSRAVDVRVASLRAKVEDNPAAPEFVVTVHRLGYRFDG